MPQQHMHSYSGHSNSATGLHTKKKSVSSAMHAHKLPLTQNFVGNTNSTYNIQP